jgi:hypothetical protein
LKCANTVANSSGPLHQLEHNAVSHEHVSNVLLKIEDSFIGLYLRKMIKIIMGKENGEEATDLYQAGYL